MFEGNWGEAKIGWTYSIPDVNKNPLLRPNMKPLFDFNFFIDEISKGRLLADQVLPVFAFYDTSRFWKLKLNSDDLLADKFNSRGRLIGYDNCLESPSELCMAINWLKYREKRKKLTNEENPIFETIKQTINEFFGKKMNFSIDKYDELVITLPDKTMLPFNNLSEGYRDYIGLIADIAYRASLLNSNLGINAPKKSPGVILIDEIDLHLHPKWQREILGKLRDTFPMMQFITTTHSPFIIQSLNSGELINLENNLQNEYADRSIEDIAENVMGINVPQRSERYQKMYETAKKYYKLLEESKGVDSVEKERMKLELDNLIAPFSDNVAYYAFLESKKMCAGLGDETNATDNQG